jgi:hypothetical protein
MPKVIVRLDNLELKPRYIRDSLKVLLHSILFTRELGVVVPRQVESECGLSYLTIDDINTDKYIEESLCAFEEKLKAVGQLELILSFFTRVEKKAFLIFKDSSKIVWEEWIIPVKVLIDSPMDSRSEDRGLRLLNTVLRKQLDSIISHACENQDHLPPMGAPESNDLIRYPFELRCPEEPWHRFITKSWLNLQ